MCEEPLYRVAPNATKKTAKLYSHWGSLFDYMSTEVNKSLSMCRVPQEFNENSIISLSQNKVKHFAKSVKTKSRYGRVQKVIGRLSRISSNLDQKSRSIITPPTIEPTNMYFSLKGIDQTREWVT